MSQPALLGDAGERRLLAALLFGNFVIGTGVLLPAGMLSTLADGLNVSVPSAGMLLLLSGIGVAIGAPVLAAVTHHFDRRHLLAGAMLLYVVSHAASALSTTYSAVMAARLAIAVTAAVFTPQAVSTIGALLPPQRRGRAITLVFVGWSLATVGGMPLAGYIAAHAGWQSAFAVVSCLAALATLAVWVTVPAGVHVAPLNIDAWRRTATSPMLALVLLVTVLHGTAQFTFFTYLTPFLEHALAATATATVTTVVLGSFGVAATIGNIWASRLVVSIGPASAVMVTLIAMIVGTGMWGLVANHLYLVIVAAVIWGLGTFAVNSVQQARLASLAPDLTSASIALNTSGIYLGQAAGSGLGALLISRGYLPALPFVASLILVLAAIASHHAARRSGVSHGQR